MCIFYVLCSSVVMYVYFYIWQVILPSSFANLRIPNECINLQEICTLINAPSQIVLQARNCLQNLIVA